MKLELHHITLAANSSAALLEFYSQILGMAELKAMGQGLIRQTYREARPS